MSSFLPEELRMRQPLFILLSPAALALALGTPAVAQSGGLQVKVSVPDSVAHVVERADAARGQFAIVSRDGAGTLVLTDTTIVMQFTDRGLARMRSKEATDSIKGAGERLLARMVLGALEPVFEHGIAYHLRDLASAEYADGRLQLRRRNGDEVFRDVKVNDTPLMESFSPEDAKKFAHKVREARTTLPAR
jgi:hypothetical protein